MLQGYWIVLDVNRFVGELAFALLIVKLAERCQRETQCGNGRTDPEFYEWWVLRIDAEVAAFKVGDTRNYVVWLVQREIVQASSDGGTKNGSANDDERQQEKYASC